MSKELTDYQKKVLRDMEVLKKGYEKLAETAEQREKDLEQYLKVLRADPKKKSRKGGNISSKFNRCVKSVKKTVRARNKESAAIAICTKSVLHTRGRTMKSYSRKRLITQKKK